MGLSAQAGPVCICCGAVTYLHCLTAAGVPNMSALSLPLCQQAGHRDPRILQVGRGWAAAHLFRCTMHASAKNVLAHASAFSQPGTSGRQATLPDGPLYCCMRLPCSGGGLFPVGTKLADAYRQRPSCPCNAGRRCELSERPLLCASVSWAAGEAVIGGSDHALYTVDLQTGKKRRTLYTKTCGHAE